MLDPKKVSEMDQAVEHLAEFLPVMLRGLYEGSVKQGFGEDQSMQIVLAYVTAFVRSGTQN